MQRAEPVRNLGKSEAYKQGFGEMKHLSIVSKKTPAKAGAWNWLKQLTGGGFGTFADSLFLQWDRRTADPYDGDIGDPDNLG